MESHPELTMNGLTPPAFRFRRGRRSFALEFKMKSSHFFGSVLVLTLLAGFAQGCGQTSTETTVAEDKNMRNSLTRVPNPDEIPPQARAMMSKPPSAPGAAASAPKPQ